MKPEISQSHRVYLALESTHLFQTLDQLRTREDVAFVEFTHLASHLLVWRRGESEEFHAPQSKLPLLRLVHQSLTFRLRAFSHPLVRAQLARLEFQFSLKLVFSFIEKCFVAVGIDEGIRLFAFSQQF